MKKLIGALSLIVLLSAYKKPSGNNRNFLVENMTRVTINQLFVSPTESLAWNNDTLGEEVIEGSKRVPIFFSNIIKHIKKFDVKAVFEDGRELILDNLYLPSVKCIQYRYENQESEDIVARIYR